MDTRPDLQLQVTLVTKNDVTLPLVMDLSKRIGCYVWLVAIQHFLPANWLACIVVRKRKYAPNHTNLYTRHSLFTLLFIMPTTDTDTARPTSNHATKLFLITTKVLSVNL